MEAIVFENRNQIILYTCELEGQLSDGHWENEEPEGHWKRMVDKPLYVNKIHGKDQGGCVNINPVVFYNFADENLVDSLGERMIDYVRFYHLFPNFPLKYHLDAWNLINIDKQPQFKIDCLEQFQYTQDDLVHDLIRMTQILNRPPMHEVHWRATLVRP